MVTPLRIQDCTPAVARCILSIKPHIALLEGHEEITLVVGCSGGADSLALLFMLFYLKQQCGYSIVVVHVNHGLREEAEEEALYVKSICRLLGIPFVLHCIDVSLYAKEHSIGIEEAGRICRYNVFECVRKKHSRAYICTAHHNNDLAEDVLMRLLRGTSLDMLFGMPLFDTHRHILRPLLYTPKSVLIQFLQDIGIIWKEDISNTDMSYLRCRVRAEVLPFFCKENPQFLASIKSLHMQSVYDIVYWNKILEGINPIKIPSEILQNLPISARIRLYRKAFTQLAIHPRSSTIFEVDSAWVAKKTITIHISTLYSITVSAKGIVFQRRN